MLRAAMASWVFIVIVMHAAACRAAVPECAYGATLLQARTSRPARVTGQAGEHLVLHDVYPHARMATQYASPQAYLLTGDRIEAIASCGDYSFVRYQGRALVSAGWVSNKRLSMVGPEHPRPADSPAQICTAAARIASREGSAQALPALASSSMTPASWPTPDMVAHMAQRNGNDSNGSRGDLAQVRLDGRAVRVVSMISGGTCSSSWVQLWSVKGRKALASTAPHATDERWWGDTQTPVAILGHPLIERFFGGDDTKFSLNRLRPDGKLQRICTVQRVYLPRSEYRSHTRNPVCRAVINGKATPISMHSESSSALHFARGPDDPSVRGGFGLQVATQPVDLRNDGHPIPIGLVSYAWDTGAECGTHIAATFPVVLDGGGKVDMSDAANRELMRMTTGETTFTRYSPSGPADGRLVRYKGRVYFVAYAEYEGPKQPVTKALEQVDQFTTKGMKVLCGYDPYHYVVRKRGRR